MLKFKENQAAYIAETKGYNHLTDLQLLEAFFGDNKEKAENLYCCLGGDLQNLRTIPIDALFNTRITSQEARHIKCIPEFANRLNSPKKHTHHIICSRDTYGLVKDMRFLEVEEFHVILLNRANRVIKRVIIGKGAVDGVVVDIKVIMKHVVENLASCIILVHNHPSGRTKPSHSDNILTQKIKGACDYMDVTLIDHVIVAGAYYYSYGDEGTL